MPKTLALVGSGDVGGTIARLAVAAGWNVIVSNTRGPESLADLVAELGELASAATPEQAAASADLAVVSIPLRTVDQLPAAALAGKTVIDTTNYYPDRDGRIAELDDGSLTASELIQRRLPGSRVVKAFNNITARHLGQLARPSSAPDRTSLPIAADDSAAKAEAVDLMDALGYDALDTGALAHSWRTQPGTPVYVLPYTTPVPEGLDYQRTVEFVLTHDGVPASSERIAALIAEVSSSPAGAAESERS